MSSNRPPSPSPSQLPPVPASPTYSYASTANPLSQYGVPPPPPPPPTHAILTKADLEHSQAAYADLLSSAKTFRAALASLSTAASAFGSALEACARLKEARADALVGTGGPSSGSVGIPGGPLAGGASLSNSFTAAGMPGATGSTCTADALLTAAGLQHLVANHQHILSETVYRSFEVPLLHDLDRWRGAIDDEEEGYARVRAAQSQEIRRLEKEGLKLNRQRRRDVAKFREHLVELTTKLDGLTTSHTAHARALLRESQEVSARIVDASCSLVRAEVDIFESLARKGWTGGGLDDVLERGVDLFASDHHGDGRATIGGKGGSGGGAGSVDGGSTLFSILPPKSILADSSGNDTIGPQTGSNFHARADSLLVDAADRYQSLTGAIVGGAVAPDRDRDADSVFSEFNRSRGVRPFSPQPQPLQLNPAKLPGSDDGEEDAEEAKGRDEGCAVEDDDEENQNHLGSRGTGGLVEDTDDEGDPWRKRPLSETGAAVEPPPPQPATSDDEEAYPWRGEGLRVRSPSTSDGRE